MENKIFDASKDFRVALLDWYKQYLIDLGSDELASRVGKSDADDNLAGIIENMLLGESGEVSANAEG